MNFMRSLINISLLKNIIKRNLNPLKISFLCFFSFYILGILSFSLKSLNIAVFCISAVVLTSFYPSYIQKHMVDKQAANHLASLPLERHTIYFTHYLSGLLLSLFCLLVEGMVVCSIPDIFTAGTISVLYASRFMIAIIALTIIYYTMAFFAVMLCGNRFGQFVCTIFLYAVPGLLYYGILLLGNGLTPGLSLQSIFTLSDSTILLLYPLLSGLYFCETGSWMYAFVHFIVTVTLFIGSYYVSLKRPIEKTGEFIIFPVVNLLIKICSVLTITILLFSFLIYQTHIINHYNFSGLILPMFTFLFMGLLLAFMLELIIKNETVYRSLLYYGITFVLCFICSIMIGRHMQFNTILDHDYTLEMILSKNDSHHSIYVEDKDRKLIKQMLEDNATFFTSNKEDDKVKITIELSNMSGIERSEYYINEKDFDQYIKKHQSLQDLLVIPDEVFKENWIFFESSYCSKYSLPDLILNKEQLEVLQQYYQEHKDDKNIIIGTTSRTYKDKEGHIRSFHFIDQTMYELAYNQQTIELTDRYNKCFDIMENDIMSQDVANVESSPLYGMEYVGMHSLFDYRKNIISLDLDKMVFQVNFYGVKDDKNVDIDVICTFEYQDGTMKLTKIEGGN